MGELDLSDRESARAKRLPDGLGRLDSPVTIHTLRDGLEHSDERVRVVQEWLDSEPEGLAGDGLSGGRILSPVAAVQLGKSGALLVHFDIGSFTAAGENIFSVMRVSADLTRADWLE